MNYAGLSPEVYGTHSIRRSRPAYLYRKTGNLRACQIMLGHKSLSKWRASLKVEAALEYSLHGLRKLAIVRLAEAGCTDAQIQSVTNQSLETIAYYRRLASRKALSKAAMQSRE